MARTKKEEVKTEEIEETIVDSTTECNENTDIQEPIIETKQESNIDFTPEFADTKLKMYSNYKELYIDNKGGVYTSKDQSSKESILYKNPYYKH